MREGLILSKELFVASLSAEEDIARNGFDGR
jgi:hypothetical protein